ncbi:MAG: SDR family oxidoreductase [Acidobacteria bacterium]|nr:SDR family oxidoreductase [Acidobacteriota bacterium]
MNLAGKVVLITGAKRVGAVVAAALADRGADVALSFNHSEREANAAAADVRARGRRAMVVRADVSDPDACDALVDYVASDLGRLDVLINMASLYAAIPFDQLTVDDWDRQLDVDLRSAYVCAAAAVPHMRKAGGGRIINFSDWVAASARPRYPGFVAYYVAKCGVKALTEALALELAKDQILVNAIAPGPVLAPDTLTPAQLKAVEHATPLGRWGGSDEVAKAVLALIDSDFITGETIKVDGGRHLY